MHLEQYSAESLTFTGLGAEGDSPHAAAEALAAVLNTWAAAQGTRRLLHLTTLAVPAARGVGLAAILAHTAGDELSGALAEAVAAVVEEAVAEDPDFVFIEPLTDPARRESN
jgi:hypothetical protein